MRKQLLLIAGTVLTLASCQNEAANTGDNQAQIDSAVNARAEELRTQMMLQNDSLINAEAQRRADSMIAAMKGTAQTPAPQKSTTQPTRTGTAKPAVKPTVSDRGTVTDRPGADKGTAKPVTDRPGADNNKPKPVTDRPGADRSN